MKTVKIPDRPCPTCRGRGGAVGSGLDPNEPCHAGPYDWGSLSEDEMRAAHVVRQINLQPEMMAYTTLQSKELECGRRVLEHHSLRYSKRVFAGLEAQLLETLQADEQAIVVSAGHIATNEAVRLAIFKPK